MNVQGFLTAYAATLNDAVPRYTIIGAVVVFVSGLYIDGVVCSEPPEASAKVATNDPCENEKSRYTHPVTSEVEIGSTAVCRVDIQVRKIQSIKRLSRPCRGPSYLLPMYSTSR